MTAARSTWSEVLVDFDGHLHTHEAQDCLHRAGVDSCRVCCPHAVETPVAIVAASEDSDWRVDDRSRMKALVVCLVAANAALVVVVLGALTLAGVIPS